MFSKINIMNRKLLISVFTLLLVFSSCKELQQLANMAKCEFKLKSVENIQLAGLNIQNISNVSQFGVADLAKLTTAFLTNEFPLNFKLNMDVNNPNPTAAALTALDWILFIDDIQMTNGILNQKFTVPANGNTTIPMLLNFDLKKVLSGKSKDALINFALNLAGQNGKPTRLMLKAKPTVNVGGIALQYPSYLSVKTDYTSK